ncbi:MAG: DegV family protein [Lachnospiraceae bacterium]|nr:DegV family protein [Lachnospiraceae bacterium]
MLKLFTDSDTDITPEIAGRYGYGIISMPYSIDGKEVFPYEDFEVFDAHAFYDVLRGGVLPKTAGISVEKYISYFEPEFAAGNDIMYIHFSRAMSGTFEAMDKAVSDLRQKYPDRKFYEIDTKGISILSLNILMAAGELYKAGKTAEEIMTWVETEVNKYTVYFFADDLKFFKASGRVSALAGTMGTLLGVRPIIYVGEDGKMTSIGKEKGRAKAVDRLIAYARELGDDVAGHKILIAHADNMFLADMLREGLVKEFGENLDIEIIDVNPTIGSHCGPDAAGISFHSIHR